MFLKAINGLILLSEDYGAYLNKIDLIDNPGPVMLVLKRLYLMKTTFKCFPVTR